MPKRCCWSGVAHNTQPDKAAWQTWLRPCVPQAAADLASAHADVARLKATADKASLDAGDVQSVMEQLTAELEATRAQLADASARCAHAPCPLPAFMG